MVFLRKVVFQKRNIMGLLVFFSIIIAISAYRSMFLETAGTAMAGDYYSMLFFHFLLLPGFLVWTIRVGRYYDYTYYIIRMEHWRGLYLARCVNLGLESLLFSGSYFAGGVIFYAVSQPSLLAAIPWLVWVMEFVLLYLIVYLTGILFITVSQKTNRAAAFAGIYALFSIDALFTLRFIDWNLTTIYRMINVVNNYANDVPIEKTMVFMLALLGVILAVAIVGYALCRDIDKRKIYGNR